MGSSEGVPLWLNAYDVGDRVTVIINHESCCGHVSHIDKDPCWYFVKLDSGQIINVQEYYMQEWKEGELGNSWY